MSVLIVEDNVSLASLVKMLLDSNGIETETVANGFEAIDLLIKKEYDVLVTDIRMPGMTGNEVFEKAKKLYPHMPVVIMTAFGNIPDAVEAIREGAFDYLTKPFENEDFLNTIRKALEISSVRKENQRLKNYLIESITPNMIGNSKPFREMISFADRVAPTDAPVLISGESGTGKELIARYIHTKSERADKQFITINCAAIPDALFESELFGHKKGSFTGADKDYKGKILEAEGGTVFLDEIGELPLAVQVKLLRFIQESEIQSVGEAIPKKVDVRVLAATNQNLEEMSQEGRFREDLYYRLNVFPINVPSLSERQDDLEELAVLFASKYGKKITFSEEAISKMKSYSWPGNIRELENSIYRISILKVSGEVQVSDLPQNITQSIASCFSMNLPEDELDLEELEKDIIAKALSKFDGNKSKTAKYLCVPRHVLLYRLDKFSKK